MATWEDVSAVALAFPEVEEGTNGEGHLVWGVRGKSIGWERPLRKGDLAALGAAAPAGPILCARVPDVGAKEALVADGGDVYFTTPHFANYPAVLVRLENIGVDELHELLEEAWLAQAPKRLAAAYLAG